MAVPRSKPSTYQLKITLLGISPPIWRRILVSSTILLSSLHDVIQTVFRWTDTHLHHFEFDGEYWGVPDDENFERVNDDGNMALQKLLMGKGWSLTYTYDFGDNWRHKILLEKILPAGTISRPLCIDGRRRRPPEDVGGPAGYAEFLKVTFEPGHEESEHFRKWGGGTFHAEEFNLKAVNENLERIKWPVKRSR